MAAGDYSLVNHGTWDLSGAAISTAVANINLTAGEFVSGGRVYIISNGNGQATVLELNVA